MYKIGCVSIDWHHARNANNGILTSVEVPVLCVGSLSSGSGCGVIGGLNSSPYVSVKQLRSGICGIVLVFGSWYVVCPVIVMVSGCDCCIVCCCSLLRKGILAIGCSSGPSLTTLVSGCGMICSCAWSLLPSSSGVVILFVMRHRMICLYGTCGNSIWTYVTLS